jgi:hypothetical protein
MKTAVEWLVEEMFKQGYLNDKPLTVNNIEYFVKQAKEMEKEQVIKHSLELAKILISNPYETSGKMPTELIDSYINETFKSE